MGLCLQVEAHRQAGPGAALCPLSPQAAGDVFHSWQLGRRSVWTQPATVGLAGLHEAEGGPAGQRLALESLFPLILPRAQACGDQSSRSNLGAQRTLFQSQKQG